MAIGRDYVLALGAATTGGRPRPRPAPWSAAPGRVRPILTAQSNVKILT
jgi:hypothetical protein